MIVKNVREDGESVVVEFDDGVRAEFVPYAHGFGYQVEGLRKLFLYQGAERVCEYSSRLYRAGPRENEHQFVSLAEGWTPARVGEYWRIARVHLNEEYFEKPYREQRKAPQELWYPWMVLQEGWLDLQFIEEGKARIAARQ